MGATVCAGDPATLSVTASGTGPLTYQWRKDDVPISGETDSTLHITAVTTEHHLDMFCCFLSYQVNPEAKRIGGFIHMVDH